MHTGSKIEKSRKKTLGRQFEGGAANRCQVIFGRFLGCKNFLPVPRALRAQRARFTSTSWVVSWIWVVSWAYLVSWAASTAKFPTRWASCFIDFHSGLCDHPFFHKKIRNFSTNFFRDFVFAKSFRNFRRVFSWFCFRKIPKFFDYIIFVIFFETFTTTFVFCVFVFFANTPRTTLNSRFTTQYTTLKLRFTTLSSRFTTLKSRFTISLYLKSRDSKTTCILGNFRWFLLRARAVGGSRSSSRCPAVDLPAFHEKLQHCILGKVH